MFGAAVIVIAAGAVYVLSFDRGYTRRHDPQTDDAYVGGDATEISARVGGYVTALPVHDNQPVKAGQLIAVIEDRDYAAERDEARANMHAAEAQLSAIEAQKLELLAQIAEMQASEGSVRATSERTFPELQRQRALLHTDVGQSRAFDQAVAQQKTTVASIQSAHAQYVAKQRQADVLETQRKQAAATLAARRQDLVLANLDLGWTRIVSPIDGTLGARAVRQGDLLNPGSVVVSVTPLDTVWVDANFTERQVIDIRPGQMATLVFDSFPDRTLSGRVAGLAPITGGRLSALPADNTTGNYTKVAQRVPVRIAVLWDGSALRGLLRPGMSAVVTVHTTSSGTVPPDAARTAAR